MHFTLSVTYLLKVNYVALARMFSQTVLVTFVNIHTCLY